MDATSFHTALIVRPAASGHTLLRHWLLGSGVGRVLEVSRTTDAIVLMGEELVDLVLTAWEAPGLSASALLTAMRARAHESQRGS